jgi:hypothetical protein
MEQVVYKLEGRSLAAAKELEAFAESYWKAQAPVQYPISILDLQIHSQQVNTGMMQKLQDERPDLMKACGLDKPITKVQTGIDAYPRAYVSWPEAYSTFMGANSEYFMYVPVGHDGSHFEPEDGVLLDAQGVNRAGNLLWAGGWQDNAPFAHRPDVGIDLPASFDPKSEHVQERNALADENTAIRAFKVAGDSLAAMQDLRRREKAYSDAVNALFEHVKDMAPKTADLPARKGKSARTADIYANLSLSEDDDGKPVVRISLRLEGKGDIMEAGQPVPVKDTEGYIVSSGAQYGEYEIVPNLNSEAGKKFRDLLDSPDIIRTDIRNYPVLRYPADPGVSAQFQAAAAKNFAGFPVQRTFGGDEYLIYRVARDDNPDLPGPKGAIPVSPQAFNWLEADASDRMRGIASPPIPKDIADELARLNQSGGAGPTPAPQP